MKAIAPLTGEKPTEIQRAHIRAQKVTAQEQPTQEQPENYLKTAEQTTEQNYNMIDGRRNNMPPKKTRTSVLVKLHQKQAEIAKRSGKEVPQMAVAEDMERRRK